MARPATFRLPKFRRLVSRAKRELGLPEPYMVGVLTLLWEAAHETGNPVFRSAEEAEATAGWEGEVGQLAALLTEERWLDAEQDGRLEIHDYFVHAPKYVRARMERELAREAAGKSLSDLRREAARARWNKSKPMQADASCSQGDASCSTPAPAPAPAPAPEGREREGAAPPAPPTPEKPATEARPRRKRPSPPEEEEWVLYALATWPEWDEDDCRGVWASYRRRGWEGTKDWQAAAKTCFHRWRRDSRGRVAAFRRPAPLVGAHPQRGTGEGPREVTADSPEWVRAVWKALGSADRPDVPDELAAAVVEWRARKRGDEEPDGWRAGLEAAWDEVRRQDAAGGRR